MTAIFATPLGALLIFCLRVVDVSMATLRLILSVRGYRWVASCIGFVEVCIWVVAAGNTLQHLDSLLHVVGYAGGFAMGTSVGVWVEKRLALGLQMVHAVARHDDIEEGLSHAQEAARALREEGYAITEIEGQGRDSRVTIINVVARRKKVPHVIDILQTHDPDVFVTVEEVRTVQGGFIRPGGRKMPFLTRT